MGKLSIKVGVLSILIMSVWSFHATNYSSGEEKGDIIVLPSLDLFESKFTIKHLSVDYFEILKEDKPKEEDLIWELTNRAHEEYIERIEQERIEESIEETVVEEPSYITFEATYYTAKCYKCSGITKSGYDVRNTIYYNGHRVIAVDPRIVPLGSLVEVITPYETFTAMALDTGGKIKNHKIDILVKTTKEAYSKGRHSVQLRIIN